MGESKGHSALVLSFDFEDWHQLVRRRVGSSDWDQRTEAFEKQIDAVLDWLVAFSFRATFFILGITAERYPELLERVANEGHEIACHGYGHRPVFTQWEPEFRRDVEESLAVLDRILGIRPVGYRAPAFSINDDTRWAFRALADMGFRYDSSLYDSPRVPRRIRPIPAGPFELEIESGCAIIEFPIAVTPGRALRIPIGGGSYWRFLPSSLITNGLRKLTARDSATVLYFHPYEFDPDPLRADLPGGATSRERRHAALMSSFRGFRSESVTRLLTALVDEFEFVTYEDLLARSERPGRARTSAPSTKGALVSSAL